MAEFQSSPLQLEVARVLAAPGSPYLRIEATILCGGKEHTPFQVLRYDSTADYRKDYVEFRTLVVVVGQGTLMKEIGPFQDDIKVRIKQTPLTDKGGVIPDAKPQVRVYRAYLGDEIPKAMDNVANPKFQSKETADLSGTFTLTLILEEVAVEQLRKMSYGFIARSCPPHAVLKTMLSRACAALKLEKAEAIGGFEMVEANNKTARDHVIVPDGTPILELPDLLQNEQGGIYSSCLGFFISDQFVHAWPLYDTARQTTARRLLRVLLSPTRFAAGVDRTWMFDGRTLTVLSVGVTQIKDESLGKMNREGNAVRYTDARKLLEGFGLVKDNKIVARRGINNSEFAVAQLGNGQHYAKVSDKPVTGNIYLEASKLARYNGIIMVVPWRRSQPELLTPGMAVEVLYDFGGMIRTIEGTFLGHTSTRELEGQGMVQRTHRSTSALVLFLDRNDPDYIAYLKSGGTISPTPDVGSI